MAVIPKCLPRQQLRVDTHRRLLCVARNAQSMIIMLYKMPHAPMAMALLIPVYTLQGGRGHGWTAFRRGRQRGSSQQQ